MVNGKTFKTSRLVSDLLSPVICSIHSSDPTIDTFTINTRHQGNFSLILNLSHFNQVNIPESEIPFISEVIEILNNESVKIKSQAENSEITVDNIFTLIKHEQFKKFNFDRFSEDIDFISSHFYEICETHESEMRNLQLDTILLILNNSKLQLNSEDQHLKFVNDLYNIDTNYSILYETVYFLHVSSQMIKEFISFYDMNFLTASIWQKLSKRLEEEVDIKSDNEQENERYRNHFEMQKGMNFPVDPNQNFNGIFNYLRKNSNINDEIDISASSCSGSEFYLPKNVFFCLKMIENAIYRATFQTVGFALIFKIEKSSQPTIQSKQDHIGIKIHFTR